MKKDMMNIIDESLNVEEDSSWKINTDLAADWALAKIREIQVDHSRFEGVAKQRIAELQMALEKDTTQPLRQLMGALRGSCAAMCSFQQTL